jgi:hypothetical protein
MKSHGADLVEARSRTRSYGPPNRRRPVLLLAACALLALCFAPAGEARQGRVNLSFYPGRIVMAGAERNGTLLMYQLGAGASRHAVTLTDRVMTPAGAIISLEEATSNPALQPIAAKLRSATPFTLVTPRAVTLSDGRRQIIRVRVNPPPDLPPGEYRTFLTLSEMAPDENGAEAASSADAARPTMGTSVKVMVAVHIPVIFRIGDVASKPGLEGGQVVLGPPRPGQAKEAEPTYLAEVRVRRTGFGSVYGDLEVWAGPAGSRTLLGAARGLAVYPEIESRAMRVTLNRRPAPGETLTATFTSADSPAPDATLTFSAGSTSPSD